MPERSTTNQRTQWGVEITSGTGVAANKRFKSFAVMLTPTETTRDYTMQGTQNPNGVQLTQEQTDATIEGWLDYVSDVYLYSSIYGAATISGIGTSSYSWVFAPNGDDVDTPTSFTVQHGSSVRAGSFTYGVLTDWGDDWSRKDVKLNGLKMLGQKYTDGITLTSNPTKVASVPVNPLDRQWFLDTTSGGLGTTRLTRVFAGTRSLTGKYGANWPSDRSHLDWSYLVNLKPKFEIKLTLMADSNGMALLTNLRNQNPTYYLRVQDQGVIMPGENVYTVSLGSPSGGNFTLTYNGVTSGNIAYNASSSTVQSTLTGLSSVGSGNATVSGSNGGPYTVTFTSALATSTNALTGNGSGLTGGTFAITSNVYYYLEQHDIAVQVSAIGELKDEEGAYAYEVTLTPVYDPTWGHTHLMTVQNQLSSL